jgi:hypothetical protein
MISLDFFHSPPPELGKAAVLEGNVKENMGFSSGRTTDNSSRLMTLGTTIPNKMAVTLLASLYCYSTPDRMREPLSGS